MPGYGRFETVEELASRGPFVLYSARPAGQDGPPAFAIKVYRTNDILADAEVVERESAAFLESARLQHSLPVGGVNAGEGHWAGIYEMGRTEDAVYYVSDLYPLTAQRMVDSRRELSARELVWVLGQVVDGLAELAAKANGRGHGGLTPSNVLVASKDEIDGARVALTDPEPDSRLDGKPQAQDLRDLAGLLFQLVTQRQPPKGGDVRTSPEWQRLGAAGEQLRLVCEQLLNPHPGEALLTHAQIKEKLAAVLAVKETKKSGMSMGAKVGIAAVVLLAVGAGVYFGVIHKAGPPADPIPPDWMTAQVEAVSGKLAAAAKKADENSDDAHEAEAASLETALKEAREKIDGLRQHTPPQNDAEARSLLAKKTEAEAQLGDVEKKIDAVASAIVVLDPEQDPRPAKWMERPLAELNELVGAVAKDLPTGPDIAPGGPDLAGLQQQVQAWAAKVEALRGKPWVTDNADPAERKKAQGELRAAVKEASTEQKNLKTVLTKARGQAREQLEKYLADQKQLNRTDKVVSSDSMREAFAIGIDTINLSDQSLGWEQVRGRVADLTAWLKGLEAAFPTGLDLQLPEGSAVDLKSAQSVLDGKRERALANAAEPMISGRTLPAKDDAAYAARLSKLKDDYQAYLGGVKQMMADAAQIEQLLSLGYGYDEAGATGKSIKNLRESVSGAPAYADLRTSVDGVLQRASDLEQVTTISDGVRLMGLISAAGNGTGAGGVSPAMAAWKKLPQTGFPSLAGELDRAAEVLDKTLIPVLTRVPDATRRSELERQAREVAKQMWFAFLQDRAKGKPDAVAAAFAGREKLGVTEADTASLEPWAQYDLARWELLNSVGTVKDPDPKEQIKKLQEMVLAFQSRIGAIKNLGERDAIKSMAARLKPFAEGKDLDLTREGPGRMPAWTTAPGDEDGTIVTYSWKAASGREHHLEFRRVLETPDSAGYLCTTEASLGLCIDVIDAFGKWDDMKVLMNPADPNFDPRRGPRVLAWTVDGKMDISRPTTPDKTGMGWHRVVPPNNMAEIPYYPEGGAPAKGPEFDDPIDFVSPAVAAYVSRLINCRLPSSAEWQAAVAKYPPGQSNLRDATWAKQHEYIGTIEQRAAGNADWPNQSMLKAKGLTAKPSETDGEPAVQTDDKVLYYAPVAQGGGDVFHHLVGNVWEFVCENPAAMNDSPFPPTAAGINTLLKRGEDMRVIGGSAISPKEFPTNTPLEFNWGQSKGGFSDAGFRLAFSTGGGAGGTGKPAERLAKILSSTDYLARDTK